MVGATVFEKQFPAQPLTNLADTFPPQTNLQHGADTPVIGIVMDARNQFSLCARGSDLLTKTYDATKRSHTNLMQIVEEVKDGDDDHPEVIEYEVHAKMAQWTGGGFPEAQEAIMKRVKKGTVLGRRWFRIRWVQE